MTGVCVDDNSLGYDRDNRFAEFFRKNLVRWGILLLFLVLVLSLLIVVLHFRGAAVKDMMMQNVREALGPYYQLIPNGHPYYGKYLDTVIGNHFTFFLATAGFVLVGLIAFIVYYNVVLLAFFRLASGKKGPTDYLLSAAAKEYRRGYAARMVSVLLHAGLVLLAAALEILVITHFQGLDGDRMLSFALGPATAALLLGALVVAIASAHYTFAFFRPPEHPPRLLKFAMLFKAAGLCFGFLTLFVLLFVYTPAAIDLFNTSVHAQFEDAEARARAELLVHYYEGRVVEPGSIRTTEEARRLEKRIIPPLKLMRYRRVASDIRTACIEAGELCLMVIAIYASIGVALPWLVLLLVKPRVGGEAGRPRTASSE